MDKEDFIKQQVQNLRYDVSEQDVMQNVMNYATKQDYDLSKFGGILKFSMQLYAEIYLETYRE